MLYYQSTSSRNIGLPTARLITGASLLAYPAGASLLGFGGFGPAGAIAGWALILASFLCVTTMMSSTIQSIVGEQPDKLDEYQLKLRSRAIGSAYTCLTLLILVGIVYLALAADFGGWVPRSYGEFNGLFWGVFLYASMLPSLFLVWQIDPADAAAEA